MTSDASPALTVAEAHARLRTHTDIQFDLPVAAPPKPYQTPEWMRFLGEMGPLLTTVFWVLVAAGALFLLWALLKPILANLRSREAVATDEQEVAKWRPEEKAARALLAEADAMAAAGNYGAAARLLLHRSLEDIQQRRPRALRPALTSREIGRLAAIPDAVRGAFAAMATPVERSLFGGRTLGRGDWEEARAAYGEFALPGSWK